MVQIGKKLFIKHSCLVLTVPVVEVLVDYVEGDDGDLFGRVVKTVRDETTFIDDKRVFFFFRFLVGVCSFSLGFDFSWTVLIQLESLILR